MSYGVANILAPELKGLNHFKPTWILNCLGVCWKVPWEMQHRCLLPLLLMPACMQSGCSAVEQTEHPKALLSFSLYRFAVPAITCSEHCSCHVFVSIERSNSYLTDLGCVCIPVSLCFPHMPSFFTKCQLLHFYDALRNLFFQLENYLVLVQLSSNVLLTLTSPPWGLGFSVWVQRKPQY